MVCRYFPNIFVENVKGTFLVSFVDFEQFSCRGIPNKKPKD